jgi:Kef-type K+ transport system membrane component KefB
VHSLLFSLAAVIVATKLLGELARRLGQPSVLGELLAGIVLGGSALALVDPRDPAMRALSDLGLFVLMFQIGLHTDVRSLRRVALEAAMVAVAGVVVPFAAGFLAARALGATTIAALIAGASLSATSVAISARTLGDKGVLRTTEGQVVLGAALADDVMGLIILSIVVALAGGAGISATGIVRTSAVSIGFIGIALVAGTYMMPATFRLLDGIRTKGSLAMLGLAFGLLLSAIAVASGTAMIMGAAAAGMILHPIPQRHEIERVTAQVGYFLVPVFFAGVGASIELRALASLQALEIGTALVAVGILGKVIAGFAPWKFKGNKLLIGAAMVPRGEVGLIFAQVGLSTGAITAELFAAIIAMVVVTTFVTPPLVSAVIRRDDSIDREEAIVTQETNIGSGRRLTTAGRRHSPRSK